MAKPCGGAASFAEMLGHIPNRVRFVVPVVCGNDYYGRKVHPVTAAMETAGPPPEHALTEPAGCTVVAEVTLPPLRTLQMPGCPRRRRKRSALRMPAACDDPWHAERLSQVTAVCDRFGLRGRSPGGGCGCPSQFRRFMSAIRVQEPAVARASGPDMNLMKSRGRGHSKRQPDELTKAKACGS